MQTEHTCQMLIPAEGTPCRHYIRVDDPGPGLCDLSTRFFCSEAMKHRLPNISYSAMSDFAHCKLRYYHGVVCGLCVKPAHLPTPMKLGRVWDSYIHKLHDPDYDLGDAEDLELSAYDQAKVTALMRAHNDLEVSANTSGLVGCQYRIHLPVLRDQLVGVVDRAYEDHIVETKLSARPDFYQQRENVAFQLGTYFLGNEAWEYADVEITRVPFLKTGYGKYSDESPEAYERRLYSDIISRPAYYFIGWDRRKRTYGVRFWRSEFDLDELFHTYVHVLREIRETCKHGSWYPNNLACHVPTACQYLPIKRSGVVSEQIYSKRGKENEDINKR